MDSYHYTRTAMAGWIFVAVLLSTLQEARASEWVAAVDRVSQAEGLGTLMAAFMAALVGIGAPPAIGFTLEKVISLALWKLKKSQWTYDEAMKLGRQLRETAGLSDLPESAFFHVDFYTHADPKLIEWARRRRANMYGALTSAAAILLAVGLAKLRFGAFSHMIGWPALILAVLFTWQGIGEQFFHETTIAAWAISRQRLVASGANHLPPESIGRPFPQQSDVQSGAPVEGDVDARRPATGTALPHLESDAKAS